MLVLECIRYWLLTRRGRCDTPGHPIAGQLFKKTNPANISGLFTPRNCSKAANVAIPLGLPYEGYKGYNIAGHYTIWSLEFWYRVSKG